MKLITIKCIFCYLLFTYPTVNASSVVTLNFTGNIKAATCNIVNENPFVVDFQKISAKKFISPKSASTWKNFNISLNNCSTYINKINLRFSGQSDDVNINSLYKNQGTAKNIAIELQNGSNSEPLGNSKTLEVSLYGLSSVNIPLRARAYSELGGGTPGSISANVTVTITYL